MKYPDSVLSTRHGGDNFLMEIMLQVSETKDIQPLLKQPKFVRTWEVMYPISVLSTRHDRDRFLMEIILQVS